MRFHSIVAGSFLVSLSTVAFAKDKAESAPPPVFQAVLDCKAVTDPTKRLACFDSTVGAMATASREKELVIADRATMKEARRGLFGLGLPSLKLFSGDGSEEVTEIESNIAGFRSAPDGQLVITLTDGARWKQTDGRQQYPKIGDKIRIRKAALGSFFANINGDLGIKVMRLAN